MVGVFKKIYTCFVTGVNIIFATPFYRIITLNVLVIFLNITCTTYVIKLMYITREHQQ